MIKVGITGQSGFIGTHLFNVLGLDSKKYIRIPFEDSFFDDDDSLFTFVSECDVIVHFAAINRHENPEVLYETNIGLVDQVIRACSETGSDPHIIFSSSIQEEQDNLYGKSKKEGRKLFEMWAESNSSKFTSLIIPNVFGPFGAPYYNSVVATFCHQLTHDDEPKIEIDGKLKLIYVGSLADRIREVIDTRATEPNDSSPVQSISVTHSDVAKVSQILSILKKFKSLYLEKGEIPPIESSLHLNLFNTFMSYINHTHFFPFSVKFASDYRGRFSEILKLRSGGQVSFSTTRPGIIRGNHFHTRKAERFAVIKGKAQIDIRRIGTKEVLSFQLDGDSPSFVDMPIWYTHNIKNIGQEDLYTLFWINEHYDPNDSDTFFEEV
jgi:UDP-2-acetamido-2,6-beta-L-arabino-hexul-4-ose reductase